MLPNWLYGKSKSKLASILGGGGGTPADYDQVKAQVTQNTEGIALLDTSSQALRNQANSIVNVLGAKNLLPNAIVSQTINGVTFTRNSDGSITANGTATSISSISFVTSFNLAAGEYILSDEANTTDTYVQVVLETLDNTQRFAGCFGATRKQEFTLNQAYTLKCYIWIASGITVDNVTFKPMLRPASIADDTYVPYAMTNQELTEKLTADANLGTAVDLSTYNAYSNLYTAPSDGYVHFLSAASGSAARTIYTYGNNTTAATDPHFTHSTSANNKAFEIFIKKGLKVYIDGLQSGDAINFYPLS